MDIKLSLNERLDYVNENLSMVQEKSGLVFTTDSYVLSAFAKSIKKGTMVDLGSGNGTISLLNIARGKYAKVYAIEIQKDYIDILNKNISINNFENKIIPINEDIRNLNESYFDESIDVVISNPPYYKVNHGKENANEKDSIARREINGNIYDFTQAASKILKYGGLSYFVYPADRLADLIDALKKANLEPKRMITAYPDLNSKPNLVFVESKKGAASNLVQSKPLIIFNSEEKTNSRKYSSMMQEIYNSFDTSHLFK